jgi:hypothetical protein
LYKTINKIINYHNQDATFLNNIKNWSPWYSWNITWLNETSSATDHIAQFVASSTHHWRGRAKTRWLGIGIMCLNGATCLSVDCYVWMERHVYPLTVMSEWSDMSIHWLPFRHNSQWIDMSLHSDITVNG